MLRGCERALIFRICLKHPALSGLVFPPPMTESKTHPEKSAGTMSLKGVKGMNDVLPDDAALWIHFETMAADVAQTYGYRCLRTPIVEHTALFTRGIGEATDIVEKEMYSFTDALNGEALTLRPENTAAIVRAALEHNLLYDGPKRIWYTGPMFRHERPQRGRYRQFHQFGIEALGFAGPDIDAEIILLGQRLWANLGLTGVRLELNSLGELSERVAYRKELIAYFEQYIDELDEDARRRLYTNPLRVLDSKNPALQSIIANAPTLDGFLGEASRNHFMQLQRVLKANGVPFTINPRLVRGLDYYNLTVFEWVTDRLGSQSAIAGGGRYDPLIAQLGGKSTPACGWALGVERVLALLKEQDGSLKMQECTVYIVHYGEAARLQAPLLAEQLRDIGMSVIVHCSPDGEMARFKSQMKRAHASGALYAVIVGEDEISQGCVSIKMLRASENRTSDSQAGFTQETSVAPTQVQVKVEDLAKYFLESAA